MVFCVISCVTIHMSHSNASLHKTLINTVSSVYNLDVERLMLPFSFRYSQPELTEVKNEQSE